MGRVRHQAGFKGRGIGKGEAPSRVQVPRTWEVQGTIRGLGAAGLGRARHHSTLRERKQTNMTDSSIRALIFDYGGVLMRTADPTSRRRLEQQLDLERGEAARLVFDSRRWDDVQEGRIDSDTFWSDVGQRLDLDDAEVAEFRQQFWGGDRLDDELISLIRHLRDEGYRTALLSNAPAGLRDYLHELGISDAFDVLVISGEEGVIKPAPEIYERALARLDVAPAEAVFIDDMRQNVEAARRVGLQATHFRGLAPLRVWLRDLGVPIPEPELKPVPDLRAVIFDWGGVVEQMPEPEEVLAYERRLGLEAGTLRQVLGGQAWRELAVGAISGDEYLSQVAEGLGLPDSQVAFGLLRELYARTSLSSEVLRTVRALRDTYQVALLTNAFATQRKTIHEGHGIDVAREFDVYVNSAEVGLAKPDPEIYHVTLDRLGAAPEQAVFLDDTLQNVDSAREVGIHAIQFVDPETSLPVLEQLLGHRISER